MVRYPYAEQQRIADANRDLWMSAGVDRLLDRGYSIVDPIRRKRAFALLDDVRDGSNAETLDLVKKLIETTAE